MKPIVVIGAARSGTRLMRALIGSHPAVDRVPYDVNFVWRLGNEDVPHDVLEPGSLDDTGRKRIRRNLHSWARGAPFLVEKTVSNTLRVPFVQKILPDAHFVQVVRNGWDASISAYERWTGPPRWGRIFQKATSFPFRQAFGYALRYARETVERVLDKDASSPPVWGPRYPGIEEDLERFDVLQVCARQWAVCATMAWRAIERLPKGSWVRVRYEDLVRSPEEELERIDSVLHLPGPSLMETGPIEKVTDRSVGRGRETLDEERRALVRPHLEEALRTVGYAPEHWRDN